MVFETTAYANSAIKPTSLLDHTKGQSEDRPFHCREPHFPTDALFNAASKSAIGTGPSQ